MMMTGEQFLVEVDIVLPADLPLVEAHDIGESLQVLNYIEPCLLLHHHPHYYAHITQDRIQDLTPCPPAFHRAGVDRPLHPLLVN